MSFWLATDASLLIGYPTLCVAMYNTSPCKLAHTHTHTHTQSEITYVSINLIEERLGEHQLISLILLSIQLWQLTVIFCGRVDKEDEEIVFNFQISQQQQQQQQQKQYTDAIVCYCCFVFLQMEVEEEEEENARTQATRELIE